MFFKICFLENFAILTRKHLCWSFFLIKFQALRLFLYNTTSGCFRYYWNYIKVPATNIKYFISSRGDLSEAVVQRCSVKKVFLEISQISQEKPEACNFIKKETLAQVFSCEFCEIINYKSKNNFSYRTPLVVASVD